MIPGFLISGEAQALRYRWLGGPAFWSSEDGRRAGYLLAGFIGILVLGFSLVLIWRRRAALGERRRFALELLDQIPFGMLLISKSGHVVFANTELRKRTKMGNTLFNVGADCNEAIKSLIDAGTIDLEGLAPEEMLARMTQDGLKDAVHEFRLSNDEIFVRRALHLRDGSILLTRQNVGEERRRLSEISLLNERLSHQIAVTNAANEELRSFAYATSHDLKAPTNTMRMLVDMLSETLQGKPSDDVAQLLGDLDTTSDRMGQLIENVLDYTNAIGSDPVFQQVDLNEALEDVMQALHADIVESDAVIERATLPIIQANPAQMHQLLQNLVGNAIKFRSPDRTPKVLIRVESAAPRYIAFSVTDNGIGIPVEHRDRVFKLFSRLHIQQSYEGTGMGLSICQRIALNHGGQVVIRDAPSHGTCFTVTLRSKQDVILPYDAASQDASTIHAQ